MRLATLSGRARNHMHNTHAYKQEAQAHERRHRARCASEATSGDGAAGGEKQAEATVLLTDRNDNPQDSNRDVVTYQVVIARR